MLSVLRTVIHRDLLLALRRRADVATVLLFFVIVVSLFPLGIGPEPNLLRAIAPGVIWVAALLSCMLALARLFAADYRRRHPGADAGEPARPSASSSRARSRRTGSYPACRWC